MNIAEPPVSSDSLRSIGPREWDGLQTHPSLPVLANPFNNGFPPSEHVILKDEIGFVRGRLSLWWEGTPQLRDLKTGLIGHYAAVNQAVSVKMLDYAVRRLKERGCEMAVGPMDGSTWHSYRLVTEDYGREPFFLEPANPPSWPDYFRRSGFQPLAWYRSSEIRLPPEKDPRQLRLKNRMESSGFKIRAFRMTDAKEELRRIFRLTKVSFRHSFLYTPICEYEFVDQHLALGRYVVPETVLLAERHGRLAGFCFAIPDILNNGERRENRALIIKTLAILPGREYAGLGVFLVAEVHRMAAALGFRRVIHALMHESNISRNIFQERAVVLRRYTLFSRPL